VDPLTETPVPAAGAEGQVTALYQAHATGLVRLAMLMLGDQPSAEDVVQDAFLGLYRRWDALNDQDRAVAYARSSVLNGCRDALRRRSRKIPAALLEPDAASAEAGVLLAEEHREVIVALRRLPARQREAVVLRHCLGLPEDEVAQAMIAWAGPGESMIGLLTITYQKDSTVLGLMAPGKFTPLKLALPHGLLANVLEPGWIAF
jgi:RNA polymerase sigma factor (sigma-70 family)